MGKEWQWRDWFKILREMQDRAWVRIVATLWFCSGLWDLALSQWVPEEISKKLPKFYQMVSMTTGLLSWQIWLLIGALIAVVTSLEYAARNRRKLLALAESGSTMITDQSVSDEQQRQILLVLFYLFVVGMGGGIWALSWWLTPAEMATPILMHPAPVTKAIPAAPPPRSQTQPNAVATPAPEPKPPWVSIADIERYRKLGRTLLIYSPQEIFAMYRGGQNIGAFLNKWVKIDGLTSGVPAPEKIQDKEFYRVELSLESVTWQPGKVAAYFDPQKYGDTLLRLRPGGHLGAICQFSNIDITQPYAGYSTRFFTFIFSGCEIV
jgi:hypothetical protein